MTGKRELWPDLVGRVRSWFYLAPPWLDWLLAFAERVDRRRRHMRNLSREGPFAVELSRHGEAPVRLRDNTLVRPGDPVILIHFRNERVKAMANGRWNRAGRQVAHDDLVRLARWWAVQPPENRPVAVRGTTILEAVLRREGLEIQPRPDTLRRRVDDWFMRWLLSRWSKEGRAAVGRGRRLISVDGWLSEPAYLARYLGEPQAGTEPAAVRDSADATSS